MAAALMSYGKVVRDIYGDTSSGPSTLSTDTLPGDRRNRAGLVLGLLNPPFLGLLAVFDTVRSPVIHLTCVLIFFPTVLAFMAVQLSIQKLLHARELARRNGNVSRAQKLRRLPMRGWVSLEKSLYWKRVFFAAFSISTFMYLPGTMFFVGDWYVYSNDVFIHSIRAVFQHLAVLNIVLFYGSFWFDLGSLDVRLVVV